MPIMQLARENLDTTVEGKKNSKCKIFESQEEFTRELGYYNRNYQTLKFSDASETLE